jgi:hypothetical protein
MFANVNDFRENDCFSSVCLHSRKMIQQIFYIMCLEQRKTKKQKKKPTPKTTGIDQKWKPPPRATPQTHREPPCNPPRAKPPPKLTQNPPRNPLRPTAQNQKSSSKSTKPHQFQNTGNTKTHHRKHHNPKSAIIKPNGSRSGKS